MLKKYCVGDVVLVKGRVVEIADEILDVEIHTSENNFFINSADIHSVIGRMVTDPVKKPSHYQGRYGMEAIDVVRNFSACTEQEKGFYWGNTVKYLLRYHSKNGIEDLKKARQNLDWLIETLEKEKI